MVSMLTPASCSAGADSLFRSVVKEDVWAALSDDLLNNLAVSPKVIVIILWLTFTLIMAIFCVPLFEL